MENDVITDEQISFSSQEENDAKIVRLHHTGTTWVADRKDSNPWLQLDLRAQNTEVTRVATQGSHQHNKWVKKYKLQYSNYGVRFQNYKEQGQTISKEFKGNTDKNSVVYHDLNPQIPARYIRFLPVEWNDEISMRVELYGCVKECGRFLGMQSGEISDEQLSTSSERDSNHSATQSRLHVVNPDRGGSWAAKNNNTDQWLQVDLVILHTIVTRVATQGSNGPKREWVTKYILQYGNDTEMFYNYTVPEQNTMKVFAGNIDQNTVVYHDLNPPITARYIRFKPVEWQDWISMRVELYGCVQGFTAVFTNLGKIGSEGPTSIGSHYKDQDHNGQVTVSSGIQVWTVPRIGEYRIEAIGASGGFSEDSIIKTGGRGARMIGNFNLAKYEIIHVLVGQKGGKGNSNPKTAGGGGGTFVVKENNKSLIIAGGGGGIKNISEQHPGCDASLNTTGNGGYNFPLGSGGSNGNGGKASTKYSGGGGGGFYSNGQSASSSSGRGGKGYLQGGEGKMLWIFRYFLVCVSVTNPVIAEDQCRVEINIRGMALKGFAFKRMAVAAPHICNILCEREIICQSYNFNRKEQICELNNRTKDARPENFRSDPAIITFTFIVCFYAGFTAVFTNLGMIGRKGPDSIGSHYKDQDHDGQVTLSSGIQLWTVPRSGEYRIEAIGAPGGYSEDSIIKTGGRGARMIGNFILTKDEIIHVLVGQKGRKGNSNPKNAGGGGGTFVVRENNKSLIVAGGGGGIKNMSEQHPGCDASINTTGNAGNNSPLGSGGSNGHGGKTSGQFAAVYEITASHFSFIVDGGGGGGFYSNGQDTQSRKNGGQGYLQGGNGGYGRGGFGGGGGLRTGNGGAGGGGGYSGGNGGAYEQFSCGGGGGSFNNGTNQQNECCFNSDEHGGVIITFLQ
ncbi:unnamed protein product [Pocillopora meandrina]|uniref:receptor protein-tyrosine kinase n=1 Tax=Pocillopora meandrina TaxID=46732 RepID=A0AAU9X5F1_9CNID|nr:unnamed protein product [Pocillopora meandrina]